METETTTTTTTIVTLLSVVLFGLGWAQLELGRLLVEPLEGRAAASPAVVTDRAGGRGIEPQNRYAGRPAEHAAARAARAVPLDPAAPGAGAAPTGAEAGAGIRLAAHAPAGASGCPAAPKRPGGSR